MDKVEVEIGKIIDAVERLGRLRTAEARMRRCDQARTRSQPMEDGSVRLDADPGMQEEQRPTLSALHHFNLDAVDADRPDADCLCHRSSPAHVRRADYSIREASSSAVSRHRYLRTKGRGHQARPFRLWNRRHPHRSPDACGYRAAAPSPAPAASRAASGYGGQPAGEPDLRRGILQNIVSHRAFPASLGPCPSLAANQCIE